MTAVIESLLRWPGLPPGSDTTALHPQKLCVCKTMAISFLLRDRSSRLKQSGKSHIDQGFKRSF